MRTEGVLLAVLMGLWGLILIMAGVLVVRALTRASRRGEVRKNGLPGEATVLECTPTRMFINHRQVVDFLLDVQLPGRTPYQVRLKSRWHDWNVRVLDVGLRLNVKVDPDDPQTLVVVGPVVAQDLGRFLLQGMEAMVSGQPAPRDPVKALADLQRMADAGLVTDEEYARKKAEILGRL
ncbi:SHOCT domain-containing protein [Corallococcus sp. EGB]|uniref:SHOCT domain-containing protein n=1 Tax=Corallococcus sp. EGB TaxID=1521117 RepID=UPI001CBD203B|nr:SHOCT domain-containing protein [Corallococcus sp. EGB]